MAFVSGLNAGHKISVKKQTALLTPVPTGNQIRTY
jgi:adenylosuccinate synthase